MTDQTPTVRHLTLSWSTSRGRETYGYNICKLRDDDTGKVYRCMGGGYDMQGTVFGEWLSEQYQDELRALYFADNAGRDTYGLRESGQGVIYADGASGLSNMERFARAIGLKVRHIVNKRGNVTAFLVTDEREGQ